MESTQENNLSIQNTTDTEPVTYCDQLAMPIENRILTLRGKQVMIDRDLAELYGVENKRLNEQVRRNVERFPEHFRFQLSNQEKDELVANCDRFNGLKHSSVITDEYGCMRGIVTMEDVIETMLGVEIVDECDTTDNLQAMARKKFTPEAVRYSVGDHA